MPGISTGEGMDRGGIGKLRESLCGSLILPRDGEYEASRRVFNGMIDRRPAAIARCIGEEDVRLAVSFARESGLPLAVRGGGHSVPGYGTCEGGLVADLSPMKGVRVDPEAQTVRAGAGLTWGELDRETQRFGLALTGGRVSSTGISGLTLGGGSGWLERMFGFTADNLLYAEVVTAGGETVRASAEENPDLFWALRGGGGNFGVVTAFGYRLHPVGPTLLAGMLAYPVEGSEPVLRAYRDFMADAPDEVGGGCAFITAPPEPFVPEPVRGTRILVLVLCYIGPPERGEEELRPLREAAPPAMDLLRPMPYTGLQSMVDAGNPPGMQNYWKAGFLNELPDAAVDALVEQARRATSPLSQLLLLPMGGAISRTPEETTPLGNREAAYNFHAIAMWPNPAEDPEPHVGWARETETAMRPWMDERVYLNFIGDEGMERVRSAFGEAKYRRLTAIKRRYDPENLFRINQNIPPGDGRQPQASRSRTAHLR
ncbi:FAD-linked oxidase [Rubrobacter xylanophilus]|uniref:FAD-linked oxidase n=1 Tax=Rubrobacter xylanophilus TaxID=49319 RepID=A0A510HHY9_9ACTN|nr:FAD-binding oxidoreductase [Rubrobacter xylanophilus]BBL78273.1 FAD-linked oxidase [Rubrobacter xylanophilus]